MTLHPIICEYRCPEDGCERTVTKSVVVLSDDLKHDAIAVSKFEEVAVKCLPVKVFKIFKFSDNCTCQYKCKTAFHLSTLMNQEIPEERHYFGEMHGKSRCDGESAVTKTILKDAVKSLILDVQSAADTATESPMWQGVPTT